MDNYDDYDDEKNYSIQSASYGSKDPEEETEESDGEYKYPDGIQPPRYHHTRSWSDCESNIFLKTFLCFLYT